VIIDVLAWLLLIAPTVNWVTSALLGIRSHRYPTIRTLRERAVTAVILSTVATAIAVLASNRLHFTVITNDVALVVLALALLAVSLPNLYWLALFATGRLGPIDDE
jgi:hypothetical protein